MLNSLKGRQTKHSNKIGLYSNSKVRTGFIQNNNDVVLNFPFKDAVLEAGMDKEDKGREERFLHSEMDAGDIDVLFEPKVLTNYQYFSQKDAIVHQVSTPPSIDFFNENDELIQNLLIKGNNLLALHSLKSRLAGKIKLIYIDPPYNTGSDSFKYNDNFNHSSWLVFMKNRLEIAKELLRDDGSIWVNLDDNEAHYCKVLCDEVFGRENFISNIIWKKKYSPQNDTRFFSDMHDHIFVFAKNKEIWQPNLLPRTDEMNARYKNPDNDPRGNWKSGDFSVKTYSASYDYPITLPSGRIVNPPKSRSWRTSEENFKKLIEDNRIWFGSDGNSVPSIKRFLTEVKQGVPCQTIWDYSEVGHNQDARKEIVELFKDIDTDFSTPKPEKLLERIIHLTTKPNDIVLDYHLGSGTTCAVAHKMGRRWIGIEQMDYIEDISKTRLLKVLDGEQGGISKAVNWQGGGAFVYFELKKYNQLYVEMILKANSKTQLEEVYKEMAKNAFLQFWFDKKAFEKDENFRNLELDERKKVLLELLDENHLYLNFADMNDKRYEVSDIEKAVSNAFYGVSNQKSTADNDRDSKLFGAE